MVALFLTILAQNCHAECKGRLISKLYLAENRALMNHAFQWKTVPSPVMCGRDCSLHPTCESFNYHVSTHACELNNATRAHSPTNFVRLPGNAYYDDNLDTPSFSVSETDISAVTAAVSTSDTAEVTTAISPMDTFAVSAPDTTASLAPDTTAAVTVPITAPYTAAVTAALTTPEASYSSCQQLLSAGRNVNGIYTIFPAGPTSTGVQVYCDMESDGGGWIVFQRRQDGSVDFYRNWAKYQSGFGDLSGEFWLGNDILRTLTESGQWQLQVELTDWYMNTAWAAYGSFSISGSAYTLHVGSFDSRSTLYDSMTSHNGHPFTTRDFDNDADLTFNCAVQYQGAWWFSSCFYSHLNGVYYPSSNAPAGQGIQWLIPTVRSYSMKRSNMKIKEIATTG